MSRPRTLQEGLINDLRRRIVAGEFEPGSRLPTRSELEADFGVSRVTIQRVFDCLARDGFVVAESGSGTLVSQYPPHLNRFGLVLGAGSAGMGGFVEALKASAATFDPSGERTIAVYSGIDAHIDNENYQQLVGDVRANRLAGLIYVFSPNEFHDPALLEQCALPSVTLTNGAPPAGMPAINFSSRSFMMRALDCAVSMQKKRVAGIAMCTGTFGSVDRELGAAIAARGLFTRPYWWQAPNHWDSDAIVSCVRLMLSGPPRERPDVFLVTDDNMISAICDGIDAARIRVPEDLAIVCQANFPRPTRCRLPATRLGPDTRAMLMRAVELIDLQRAGKPVPVRSLTHAVASDEALLAPVGRARVARK